MPNEQLTSFLLLPELKLMSVKRIRNRAYEYNLVKESKFEVCPKCATKSSKASFLFALLAFCSLQILLSARFASFSAEREDETPRAPAPSAPSAATRGRT